MNSDALIGLSVIGAANALCHLFNNTYLETLRHHVKVSKMSSAKTEGSFPHAAVALGDTHTLAKQTKQQVSRCQASDSFAGRITTAMLWGGNRFNLLCGDGYFKLLGFVCIRNHQDVLVLFSSTSPKSEEHS